MSSVQILLLVIASMFLLGSLGEVLFRRTGIPDVIWLVAAGIGLGPIGGVVSRTELTRAAPYIAAITLVVILFDGGVTIKLRDLRDSAPRSGLVAVLGFVFTVSLVAIAGAIAMSLHLCPPGWTVLHGVLVGTILGGSSSLIIMPAMAQSGVRARVADLLKLESAVTDILCVVFTAALIKVLAGAAADGSAGTALIASFGIALAVGVAAGLLWVLLLRLVKLKDHAYPITLAALFGLYVLVDRAGGSPALGIFAMAVVMGNAGTIERRLGMTNPEELDAGVRSTHQQVSFIIKTFFFVFLGAMLRPPWTIVAVGAGLGTLLLAVRVPAVWLATIGTDLTRPERRLVAVALPRGLAAGVLATMPTTAGIVGTERLPDLVFSAVIVTIVVFAIGFGAVARAARNAQQELPGLEANGQPSS